MLAESRTKAVSRVATLILPISISFVAVVYLPLLLVDANTLLGWVAGDLAKAVLSMLDSHVQQDFANLAKPVVNEVRTWLRDTGLVSMGCGVVISLIWLILPVWLKASSRRAGEIQMWWDVLCVATIVVSLPVNWRLNILFLPNLNDTRVWVAYALSTLAGVLVYWAITKTFSTAAFLSAVRTPKL